ncbi:hypothetical protein BDV12DRAFT_202322 [Aspergillus spectabilis]
MVSFHILQPTPSNMTPSTSGQAPQLEQARTFQVDLTSWSGRHVRITEGHSDGPLVYAADLKPCKPHMLFQASGTSQLPATVIFRNFSRTIETNIDGEDIPMKPVSR